MPTKREIYLRRLDTVRAELRALNADGLYATPSSNLFYLTGIDFHRSERLTALLLFQDMEPVAICPAFEAERLRRMSAVERVVTWEETEDPFAIAAALFPASGGTLAIEPSTAYDDVERLLARRPAWKPVSAASTFGVLRMIKSADELDMIRQAIAVALPRFQRAFAALKPGCLEAEISALVGGENMVQFGPSSALPHGASGSTPLARDQAVLIDAWDKPDGYYYDITRSTYYGTPTDEYRKIWSIVLDAQSAAIDKAAPGVPCSRGRRRGAPRHREGRLRRVLHAPPRPRPGDRRARGAVHGRPRQDHPEAGDDIHLGAGHLPAGALRRAHRGRRRLHRARRGIPLPAGFAARADRRVGSLRPGFRASGPGRGLAGGL